MRFSRLAVLPLLLTACASPRPAPSIPVDTVEPPAEAVSYSVLTRERLHLEGAARWEMATVGEVIQRASVTDADRQRAAQVLASGAYLDDPQGVVRLTDPDVTERFQSGTAYLPDAFPADALAAPFEMGVTFELAGGDGTSVGLSLEVRDPDGTPTGDVGQLLVTLMDPGTGPGAELGIYTRSPEPGAQYQPVGGTAIAPRDWRGAHRLVLVYEDDALTISLDDEPLETATVRLDRPAGPVYLGAFAPTPTMGVTLLDWWFLPR